MLIKASELIGNALDWAVAKCEGISLPYGLTEDERYSTDWGQGGPIIERKRINIYAGRQWTAASKPGRFFYGPTPLVAAMRCYVGSKLGEEVDIPKEITK